MRFAQLVLGPAGSGKSTYCSAMVQHGVDCRRSIDVVNLDPAAEHFDYQPVVDIRELIHVEDTMSDEQLRCGPNGGLVYCIEYLVANAGWLLERIGEQTDDYLLFDCPGQIELYTHLTPMRRLIAMLQTWGFAVCSVYLVDAQFMTDGAKFLSGTMSALSAMANLEVGHVNVLTKMDLLSKGVRKQVDRFLVPDARALVADVAAGGGRFGDKYRRLTASIGRLLDDYALVRFVPLNLKSPESVADVLLTIDSVLQYDEDLDVKTKDFGDGGQEADD